MQPHWRVRTDKESGGFLPRKESISEGASVRTETALTSESREGGREGGGGEGTVGPGQSGLAVAAGQTSRQAEEEEHERRIECREDVLVAAEVQKINFSV